MGRAGNFSSTTKLYYHITKEYFYETPVNSIFEITEENIVNVTLHRIFEQIRKSEYHPYGKHIACIISFIILLLFWYPFKQWKYWSMEKEDRMVAPYQGKDLNLTLSPEPEISPLLNSTLYLIF